MEPDRSIFPYIEIECDFPTGIFRSDSYPPVSLFLSGIELIIEIGADEFDSSLVRMDRGDICPAVIGKIDPDGIG
jgi:hypothetical protein